MIWIWIWIRIWLAGLIREFVYLFAYVKVGRWRGVGIWSAISVANL